MKPEQTIQTPSKQAFNHRKYRPFPTIQKDDRRWPSQQITKAPLWCAVDLRDGNQALIEPMTVTQKQRMWALLIKLGFKHIEIGFPSASQPDFDFCRWLIEENQIPDDVTIQVLTQARESLIKRTYEALNGVKQAIVHVYNSTSPVQRNKVFKTDKAGIIDIAQTGAQIVLEESKKYPNTDWTFEYSPESFSSTEVEFAIDVCNAVIDVWQPTPSAKAIINLPATVECASPNVFADQVETFCDKVNRRDAIIVSLHTHNDRGCAVAAAEMGLLAGADRIEGTLMGNGERTGNMDIITMAMNLYSQGINPELDLSDADEIVSVVSECTQIAAHPRHPWVGELVYTAFSGSHQDAIRKCLAEQYLAEQDLPEHSADHSTKHPIKEENQDYWDVAYLPIDPQDLGRDYQSVIRVNSQSGKGGVAYILEHNYGLHLPRWLQIEASSKIQSHAEAHAIEVTPEKIWEIMQDTFMSTKHAPQLKEYHVDRQDNHEVIQACLQWKNPHLDNSNTDMIIQGQGDGALSAFCQALENTFNLHLDIIHYDQHAIGSGTNAQAIAYVQVKVNGERFCGIAKNNDTLSANLAAILACISQASPTMLALKIAI